MLFRSQSESNAFQKTGGVHNAALCTVDELLIIKTDIGRHNALDKIYGYILEKNIPLADKVIAFSGRISSEVLLKISKMGIGIIISKDRKSTRLNSSHVAISYAVFCLKKKKENKTKKAEQQDN